ncbi:hypothetical protein [Bacillus sp. NPDC094106]|uniref:hypothetical protein n=1 Tax=Bacillus sp. NPDC094106 TaxID=3363949 RepID=UPI003819C4B5
MSITLTTKSHLKKVHELSKKYPAFSSFVPEQKRVLDNIQKYSPNAHGNDVAIDSTDMKYFEVETPRDALNKLIKLYGKEEMMPLMKEMLHLQF